MLEKIKTFIRFSLASRKYLLGESCISPKAKLVLIANDASPRSKKFYEDKLSHLKIKYLEVCSKEELGSLLGKSEISAFGFTDINMAQAIVKEIKKEDENNGKKL
jgi:ribosomal protein L7Ae-like RNA K-turn-binding protein